MEEVFPYLFSFSEGNFYTSVCRRHPTDRGLKALQRKIQTAVNQVAKWADSTGYEMAAKKKCILAHVCGSNHRLHQRAVTLNVVISSLLFYDLL